MHNAHIMGLFRDFDTVSKVVREVQGANLPSIKTDSISIKSPIEHPQSDELLGNPVVHVQKYTLIGALLGGSLGFLLIAAAQANFFAQQKGGKPIVPLPPDFVLTYEMLILGGVYITVLGFLICACLPRRVKSSLYSIKVSQDQIAVIVRANVRCIAEVRKILQKHDALDIHEEAAA